MKEIGGYIELDQYHLPMLHDKAIALNCGRNCLAFLIQIKNIKKISLPKLICKSIIDICKKEKIEVRYYSIDEQFLPDSVFLEENEWIYLINYYGQLSNQQIEKLSEKYHKIIVDQTHAYFQMPVKDVDTLYTCRKFFGVPDGAFLYTDCKIEYDFPLDESYQRINFLMGRYERTASEFYDEYVANDKFFDKEPIKKMSRLTRNLLHGIDYKMIKDIRTENYCYLFDKLNEINMLKLKKVTGAFMYPFYIEGGEYIRKKLQKKKIYIPILWPNVKEVCNKNELEYQLSINILPLPCDQRYGEKEMNYIIEQIMMNL